MSIFSFNNLGFSVIPTNPLLSQPNPLIENLWILSLKETIRINILFHQLILTSSNEQLDPITLQQFLWSILSNKKLTNETTSIIFNTSQVIVHADLLIKYYSVINLNIELILKRLANQPINPIVKPADINLSSTLSVEASSNTDEAIPVDNHEGVDAEEDISQYFR